TSRTPGRGPTGAHLPPRIRDVLVALPYAPSASRRTLVGRRHAHLPGIRRLGQRRRVERHAVLAHLELSRLPLGLEPLLESAAHLARRLLEQRLLRSGDHAPHHVAADGSPHPGRDVAPVAAL